MKDIAPISMVALVPNVLVVRPDLPAQSLAELVALLEQNLGRPARLKRLPDQPGDVPITYADVSAAQRELGYRCRVPVAEGIRRFCAWYVAEQQAGAVP